VGTAMFPAAIPPCSHPSLQPSLPAAIPPCDRWSHRSPSSPSLFVGRFAGSFCGAASAFAGHASDARALYRGKGVYGMLKNAAAHLVCSGIIFFVALEVRCAPVPLRNSR
jgi:hypothetical protein